MRSDFAEIMKPRYVKIVFTVTFAEDCVLPRNKASAIRGGMGEMLLRANCVRDRDCENCDFESECIVRRTMYSRFDIKPDFVTTGESIGYVLECEDHRKEFSMGDRMNFTLILFGKTIVYFNQFLQAFAMLGVSGLGRNNARFAITSVRNPDGGHILDGNSVNMANYRIESIGDYVERRLESMDYPIHNRIVFQSPLTLKHMGEFIQEFEIEPIINAVLRRLYMLDCFEGMNIKKHPPDFDIPVITEQEHTFVSIDRYSNRQGSRMSLKGIKGEIKLDDIGEEALAVLLAGELIHIGKNTSFGFGKYIVY